jgi:hypothetical protein
MNKKKWNKFIKFYQYHVILGIIITILASLLCYRLGTPIYNRIIDIPLHDIKLSTATISANTIQDTFWNKMNIFHTQTTPKISTIIEDVHNNKNNILLNVPWLDSINAKVNARKKTLLELKEEEKENERIKQQLLQQARIEQEEKAALLRLQRLEDNKKIINEEARKVEIQRIRVKEAEKEKEKRRLAQQHARAKEVAAIKAKEEADRLAMEAHELALRQAQAEEEYKQYQEQLVLAAMEQRVQNEIAQAVVSSGSSGISSSTSSSTSTTTILQSQAPWLEKTAVFLSIIATILVAGACYTIFLLPRAMPITVQGVANGVTQAVVQVAMALSPMKVTNKTTSVLQDDTDVDVEAEVESGSEVWKEIATPIPKPSKSALKKSTSKASKSASKATTSRSNIRSKSPVPKRTPSKGRGKKAQVETPGTTTPARRSARLRK